MQVWSFSCTDATRRSAYFSTVVLSSSELLAYLKCRKATIRSSYFFEGKKHEGTRVFVPQTIAAIIRPNPRHILLGPDIRYGGGRIRKQACSEAGEEGEQEMTWHEACPRGKREALATISSPLLILPSPLRTALPSSLDLLSSRMRRHRFFCCQSSLPPPSPSSSSFWAAGRRLVSPGLTPDV